MDIRNLPFRQNRVDTTMWTPSEILIIPDIYAWEYPLAGETPYKNRPLNDRNWEAGCLMRFAQLHFSPRGFVSIHQNFLRIELIGRTGLH